MDVVSADVAALRRFNRYFTRRTGVLSDRYLGQERPLGEARVLFEIGDGASLRELRGRLGLDPGYLSRVIRALERQGLVRVSVPRDDGRLRFAELTAAGREERREQHRRAEGVARGLLHGLGDEQRAELTGALATAERLLRLAALTVEECDAGSADARRCLDAYAAEIHERFPEGFDDAELVRAEEVSGRAGAFLVAYEEGRPVGCGALRTLGRGVGEIRHVWVDPAARGLGIGRRLLAGLERQAVERGLRVLRLGTHESLTEAQQMYRTAGYAEIPDYGGSAHANYSFEKRLDGHRSQA